jgi:hypothetical protein
MSSVQRLASAIELEAHPCFAPASKPYRAELGRVRVDEARMDPEGGSELARGQKPEGRWLGTEQLGGTAGHRLDVVRT